MFGEHVVTRFTASLDPTHLQPWHYYFVFLFEQLVQPGTLWSSCWRRPADSRRASCGNAGWPAPSSCYWFWLPFVRDLARQQQALALRVPVPAPLALAAGYCLDRLAALAGGAFAADRSEGLAGRFALPAVAAQPVARIPGVVVAAEPGDHVFVERGHLAARRQHAGVVVREAVLAAKRAAFWSGSSGRLRRAPPR